MEELRGKSALDVGFAAGHNSIHLAQEYGMNVTGIDVFDKWFEMARLLASMAAVDGIDFVKASADRYQKPEAFDLIVHFGTLYHLPNPLLSSLNARIPVYVLAVIWVSNRRVTQELIRIS